MNATRADDVVKVARKNLPVVESVINDGRKHLANLDKFFARQDQNIKNAPGTIRNDLVAGKKALWIVAGCIY